MLVVVIGIVLVVVTTDVAAGWVCTDVIVVVVPGAVLQFGAAWSANTRLKRFNIERNLRGLSFGRSWGSGGFSSGVS